MLADSDLPDWQLRLEEWRRRLLVPGASPTYSVVPTTVSAGGQVHVWTCTLRYPPNREKACSLQDMHYLSAQGTTEEVAVHEVMLAFSYQIQMLPTYITNWKYVPPQDKPAAERRRRIQLHDEQEQQPMSQELIDGFSDELRDALSDAALIGSRSAGHVRIGCEAHFDEGTRGRWYYCTIFNWMKKVLGDGGGATPEAAAKDALADVAKRKEKR